MVGPFPITSILVKDILEWEPTKKELEKYNILYFNYNIKDLDFDKIIYLK